MLKNLGIYTISNLLNAAIPFLLLPLLTNYLSPAEFGIVATFQVLMNGLLPFVGLNSEGAISRQYFDRDSSDFKSYVSNSLLVLALSSIVAAALFILPGKFIEKYSDFPSEWLWSVVAFTICMKLTEILLAIWRVQNKAMSYGVFRLLRTGLDMGLSVYFVVVLKRSWEGRIEGQLVASVFFAVITLYYFARGGYLRRSYNADYVRSILKFGIPLIPHVLGAVIMTYSDRLFITNMVGIHEMGLYAAGYQIGMVIGLVQNSFNQAWQPWLFEKMKSNHENDKLRIVKFTYIYFVGILIIALIVTLASELIVKIMMDESFSNSAPFIGWIAFGFAFNGMYKMVVNYLFYLRSTKVIGLITLATAVLSIGLNYFLIRLNGPVGAAQASTISFMLQFVLIWHISNRQYPLPWKLRTVISSKERE